MQKAWTSILVSVNEETPLGREKYLRKAPKEFQNIITKFEEGHSKQCMDNEMYRLHDTVRKKIYKNGWTDAVRVPTEYKEFYEKFFKERKEFFTKIKLDKYRYGKPKDNKPVRCEKARSKLSKQKKEQ
jgi:hypothetical protein